MSGLDGQEWIRRILVASVVGIRIHVLQNVGVILSDKVVEVDIGGLCCDELGAVVVAVDKALFLDVSSGEWIEVHQDSGK